MAIFTLTINVISLFDPYYNLFGHWTEMKGHNFILIIYYLQGMKMSHVWENEIKKLEQDNRCLRENEIRKLEQEGKCASISHELQMEECMKKLSIHYIKKCKTSTPASNANQEDLVFCENEGNLTCCFPNVKCEEDHEDGDDYHVEDIFSTDCHQGKEKKGICVTIGHGRLYHLQWERCMEQLSKNLDVRCKGMGLEQVIMIYIRNRV